MKHRSQRNGASAKRLIDRLDRAAHDMNAMLLVLAIGLAALDAVAALRPRAWPNLRILEFGDELLCRNGEIVAAVGAIYRRVLDRDPAFQEAMIDGGRGREVMAALRGKD